MATGNLYPEICVFLLAIFALKASSKSENNSPTRETEAGIECTLDMRAANCADRFQCFFNSSKNYLDCTSNNNHQTLNMECRNPLECSLEQKCYECDLESTQQAICCDDDGTKKGRMLTCNCAKPPSSPSTKPTSSSPPSATSSSSTKPTSSSPPSTTSSSSLLEQIQKLENDTISELDSLNITSVNSLQEAANSFENFTTTHRNMTLGEGQSGVENFRKESIFKVAVAFEKIVLRYGKYHLRGANRSKRISYPHRNMFLVIQKDCKQNASDFYLENHEWQAYINISSGNCTGNGSVIVVCVYKDLHSVLQPNSTSINKTRLVLSRITMVAMDPKPEKLQENVILRFKNLKNDTREKHCEFWSGLDTSQDGFSKDGCHLVTSQSNSEETVCSCNHLTHFAVLVDYRGSSLYVLSQKDEDILEIITYVGLSLSIIGIIFTVIMYSLFTDIHQPLTQIRLSLATSLGAGQISFLAGMHAMGHHVVCKTAAVLTQYFLMAAFCWMLVEGIHFYLFIVKVYNISNKIIVYHAMAWGFPIIMVGISLGFSIGKGGIESYTSDKHCWLSSAYGLIWIFVTFLTATVVLSTFILARVIRELTTLPQTGATKIRRVRLGIRTCVVMIPLLGITWSVGLLSPLHKTFTYIFTILNSTQGFLIFTLHCVRNSQIMERLKRKMITKKTGQIRRHLRGRVNVVSPSPNNTKSAEKNTKIHPCDSDAVLAGKYQSPKI